MIKLRKIKQDSRFVFQSIQDIFRTPERPLMQVNIKELLSIKYSAAWIGHATIIIHFDGVLILTDPVLYPRLGPYALGPKRYVAPSLEVNDVPSIDVALISHAHVDHLDIETIRNIKVIKKIICPEGVSDLIIPVSDANIYEMKIDDVLDIEVNGKHISVCGLEVNHQNGRFRGDSQRKCIGYLLGDGEKKLAFIGDSAWAKVFYRYKNISPDIFLVPIGGYQPFRHRHFTPEDAIKVMNIFNAKRVIPHQHGTFKLSFEAISEPVQRFVSAIEKEKVPIEYCVNQGEVFPF